MTSGYLPHSASQLTMETARWRETINLDDLWEGEMTAVTVTVDGEVVLLVNLTAPSWPTPTAARTRPPRWTRVTWTARG